MVRDSISHSYYVTLQGIKHIHDKNREEQLINAIKCLRVQWNQCDLETTLGHTDCQVMYLDVPGVLEGYFKLNVDYYTGVLIFKSLH